MPIPPRTLIADDQPDVLEALRLLLKREGYQIDSASSPKAVIESLAARDYDVLLMDLNYALDTTSGQEGLDLLERIRKLDNTLPVVVMTAWGSIPLAVEAMRRGARDFVEKPWENEQLLEKLRRHIAARGTERGREREEVEDAAAVQRNLLPRDIPPLPGFEISVTWQPARAVGGDYVDFLKLGADRLAVGVADVIGKGVGAALLMSNVQAAVRSLAAHSRGTDDLAGRVNRVMAGNTGAGKYITFFYGVIDAARRTFAYTNAGHNAPVLVRASGECLRLEEGGAVLGVFPHWEYGAAEVRLAPGDRLVLFTDGVTETQDAAGEDFGDQRLVELIRANRTLDAGALRRKIMAELAGHGGECFEDDVTLVVVAVA
jgi:phosphoserine phosphatase RsbU/P